MSDIDVSGGVAARLLSWLRTPADLAFLGLAWTIASLPIVTVVLATTSLFDSLRSRDTHDERRMLAAYARGIRSTWPVAARLSMVVLPVLCAQIVLAVGLLLTQTAAAAMALGFLAVVSVVWWSYLLALHATVCLLPGSSLRVQVGIAFRAWLQRPVPPVLAVIVGATIGAAAAQSFWVIAIFAVSVPAWIAYRRHPLRMAELEEEAR